MGPYTLVHIDFTTFVNVPWSNPTEILNENMPKMTQITRGVKQLVKILSGDTFCQKKNPQDLGVVSKNELLATYEQINGKK